MIATFEDGSAAVLVNRHGKGLVITIVTDTPFAVSQFPDLVRDAFDRALTAAGRPLPVDLLSTDDNFDNVIKTTEKRKFAPLLRGLFFGWQ
ncbi:MAG TPA: hypothetical protein VEV84_08675 [Pyrinomonadaceae bacterium]|nr:hypothetical protein [Pyrinomonadaceae bacterium]